MDCLIKFNREINNCKKYHKLINYIHKMTKIMLKDLMVNNLVVNYYLIL